MFRYFSSNVQASHFWHLKIFWASLVNFFFQILTNQTCQQCLFCFSLYYCQRKHINLLIKVFTADSPLYTHTAMWWFATWIWPGALLVLINLPSCPISVCPLSSACPAGVSACSVGCCSVLPSSPVHILPITALAPLNSKFFVFSEKKRRQLSVHAWQSAHLNAHELFARPALLLA